jgi:hypothetical protein
MSITYASLNQLLASPFQRLTSAMWNTAALTLIQLYETGGNTVSSVLQNGNLYLPGNISAISGDFLYQVYVQGQPVLTEEDPIYISGFISLAASQILQIINSQQQLYSQLIYLPYDIYTNFMKIVVPSIYENVAHALATQKVSQQLSQLPYQIYSAIASSPLLYLPQQIYESILYAIKVSDLANLLRQAPQEIYHAFYTSPLLGLPSAIYGVLASFLAYFYSQTVALTNTINKLTLYLAPPTVEGLQLSVSTKPAPIYSGPSIETLKVILQNLSNYIVYLGNSLYNQFPLLPNSSIEFHVSNPASIYAWATGPATVYALFEIVKQS